MYWPVRESVRLADMVPVREVWPQLVVLVVNPGWELGAAFAILP